jgi:serine/threonine-protein kinase RsbW
VEIKLSLALPRDELSVPVVRRVLTCAMEVLGVDGDVTADVQVALTEACTNVLKHADEGDEYVVSAGIDGDLCVVEIIDRGAGFDGDALGHADAGDAAEQGRGIQLMRALVDRVSFDSRQTEGTVVHLEKRLEWDERSVIRRLTDDHEPTEHGPWSDGRAHDGRMAAPEAPEAVPPRR